MVTRRASSITNTFLQAGIPRVAPTPTEIDEALNVLGMAQDSRTCAYCGTPATDWDHLRPMAREKRPTGCIDEIPENSLPMRTSSSEFRRHILCGDGSTPGLKSKIHLTGAKLLPVTSDKHFGLLRR